MVRMLVIVCLATLALGAPADASEKKKSKKKEHVETGASCKAPPVGACASCAITCRPGETATCGPGMVSADLCARPPSCACK
jgi:hypothetical protein